MAKYGAKRPAFATIKSEPENALPTYDPASIIGRLIKAEITPQFASGKLYADDALAESADEFVSADSTFETDDMTDPVAEKVYGCKVINQEVHYKSGDTPPYGGLAFYVTLMRKGVKSFKGYFYPRAKATLGGDSAQTKGDNITFGTTTTKFTITECNTGDWKITKEFKTEQQAIAWCDSKLGGTPVPPDPDDDPPTTGDN